MEAKSTVRHDAPWTLGRLRDWTAKFLEEKGSEFPRLDAEVLLAHVLGCKRIELYVRNEEHASEEVRTRYKELIRKRVAGCPVAYLVGKKEFFSLELEVNPQVLIPRPDTETLVAAALEVTKGLPAPHIVDVGTGSGAIVIALAKNHAGAKLAGIDIGLEALALAQRNAVRLGLGERIRFLHGDLLGPLDADEQFDLIVSNPPYIAHDELAKLPVGVQQYEPHLALDGGPDGYEVIDRLVRTAGQHLKPGGYLLVEIGSAQEERVRELIGAQAGFQLEATIKDFSRKPRCLRARWGG